jgi:hypothetical protein
MALSLDSHRLVDAEWRRPECHRFTKEKSASDDFAPRHYFADSRMSIAKVELFRQ